MNVKRIDPNRQKPYTGGKEFFEFRDLSGLPKGIREAMNPLKNHVKKVALDTIKDAIDYIEHPGAMDKAIVLTRLQKLYRLLGHLEGKTDGDLHGIGSSSTFAKGESLDGPIEIGGMGNRGATQTRQLKQSVLDRLEHARRSSGKVLQPRTPKRGKV